MADPEGWEVWDERGSDRKRDPNIYDDEPERKPLGTGWLIGLIFGGILLLAIVGVAFYWLLDDDINVPPQPVMVPPRGPGPFIGPGGPGGPGMRPGLAELDETPVAQETQQEVLKLLKSLGQEMRKADYDPAVHFELNLLASNGQEAVPLEPHWGQQVHIPELGTPPVDRMNVTRSALRLQFSSWRRLDWANATLLTIHTSDLLGLQAVVRYSQPSGPTVRLIWSFTPNPIAAENEFAWKISTWQDLTTGVSAELLIAQQMIQRAEQRYDLYGFTQLNSLHRQIDEREFDQARTAINRLYQSRPVGAFRDLTELADSKLRLREYEQKNALAIINGIYDRNPKMDAIHAVRAEAASKVNNWDQTVLICEDALKRYGDDPAVLSYLGEALIAINKPFGARPHIKKALALDPDNETALNAFRKIHTDEEKETYAKALQASTRFPKIFANLAVKTFSDQDWSGLEVLSREYIAQRADDSLGHLYLIRALANLNRQDEAFEHFYQVAPQYPDSFRRFPLEVMTDSIVEKGQTLKVYATVPQQWKESIFAVMAQHLENRYRYDFHNKPVEGAKVKQELRELMTAHAAHDPNSSTLMLFQANELIEAKKWDEAEAKLAAIPRKPREPDHEYDPMEAPLREAKVKTWYALKKWDAALSEKTQSEFLLLRLATLCLEEKDLDRMESLLAAAEKKAIKANSLPYWKGILLAERGKHAEALTEYRKLLKADPRPDFDDESDDDDGRYFNRYRLLMNFTVSAVKANRAVEAVKVLETEEYVSSTLFAYALISAGEEERALRYLTSQIEEQMIQANAFYSDSNLGPLLKQQKPAFNQFRIRFPEMKPNGEE